MTAKELLKWKIEPLPGAFASPLQPLLEQLQSQVAAAQFADALRSLHDSLMFLTMFYSGLAVGSLRSVTPLGPDLTLLLDEPPSAEHWNRLLRQSWQDWAKHPHHPALDVLRQVFFLSSRLQSSRLGARRHSRWLGLDHKFPTNGETFGSWSETVRKARNINPEAAARQLVLKLPLLNIWLRASQEFLSSWSLRLDQRQEPGTFRYLISRDDCRFDTVPNFNTDLLLVPMKLVSGSFTVEAVADAAAPAPTAAAASPAAKDVGLQWDPVTKSYRLTGGAEGTAAPSAGVQSPPAAPSAGPAPASPALSPPPTAAPAVASPSPAPTAAPAVAPSAAPTAAPTPVPTAAPTPVLTAKPAAEKPKVTVEWDPATNSYKMVPVVAASSPETPVHTPAAAVVPTAAPVPTPAPVAPTAAPAPTSAPVASAVPVPTSAPVPPTEAPVVAAAAPAPPADELDELLKAELESLDELLSEEHVTKATAALATPLHAPAPPTPAPAAVESSPVPAAAELVGAPVESAAESVAALPEVSPDATAGTAAEIAETVAGVMAEDSVAESVVADTAAPPTQPSLAELIADVPASAPVPPAATSQGPGLSPSPDDLLEESPAPTPQPAESPEVVGPDFSSQEPLAEEPTQEPATRSFDELFGEEPAPLVADAPEPVTAEVEELFAEQPAPTPAPEPVAVEPSPEKLFAEAPTPTPAPSPEPVAVEPSAEELFAEEPAPTPAPEPVAAEPSLEELFAEEPAPTPAPEPVAAEPSPEKLFAESATPTPAPQATTVEPSLEELFAEEPAPTPAPEPEPAAEPVAAEPSLEELFAEAPSPTPSPQPMTVEPSLAELFAEEPAPTPAPEPVAAESSLEELFAEEPAPTPAPEPVAAEPSLEELFAEEPAPTPAPEPVAAESSLEELFAEEPAPTPAPEPVAAEPSLEELFAEEPAPTPAPAPVAADSSLEELFAEEPAPTPAPQPEPAAESSLEELFAEEPAPTPAPEPEPAAEASLEELFAEEPAPTPAPEPEPAAEPSLEELFAETATATPTPTATPAPEPAAAQPSLEELFGETSSPVVTPELAAPSPENLFPEAANSTAAENLLVPGLEHMVEQQPPAVEPAPQAEPAPASVSAAPQADSPESWMADLLTGEAPEAHGSSAPAVGGSAQASFSLEQMLGLNDQAVPALGESAPAVPAPNPVALAGPPPPVALGAPMVPALGTTDIPDAGASLDLHSGQAPQGDDWGDIFPKDDQATDFGFEAPVESLVDSVPSLEELFGEQAVPDLVPESLVEAAPSHSEVVVEAPVNIDSPLTVEPGVPAPPRLPPEQDGLDLLPPTVPDPTVVEPVTAPAFSAATAPEVLSAPEVEPLAPPEPAEVASEAAVEPPTPEPVPPVEAAPVAVEPPAPEPVPPVEAAPVAVEPPAPEPVAPLETAAPVEEAPVAESPATELFPTAAIQEADLSELFPTEAVEEAPAADLFPTAAVEVPEMPVPPPATSELFPTAAIQESDLSELFPTETVEDAPPAALFPTTAVDETPISELFPTQEAAPSPPGGVVEAAGDLLSAAAGALEGLFSTAPAPTPAAEPPAPTPSAAPPQPETVAEAAEATPAATASEPTAPPDPPVPVPVIPHVPVSAEPAPVAVIDVAEEIEEYDSYQFDPHSGPPQPPWKAWTGLERDQLDQVVLRLGQSSARFDFSFALEVVRGFINKARGGYLLLEADSGLGKSYFGNFMEAMAPQVHPRGIRVVYLKVPRRPHGDHETFIEAINDAIAVSNAPRTHRVLPLERLALHDLAVQYPNPKRQERFQAYLSGLAVHNRGPVLLYLDEIDRRQGEGNDFVSPADYLPEQLPDNVYVIVTYRPDSSAAFRERLQKLSPTGVTRHTIEPAFADYRRHLDAELARIEGLESQTQARQAYAQAGEYLLHYSRLTAQAGSAGLVDANAPPRRPELYRVLLERLKEKKPERFAAVQHFLMSLSAAFEPIPWEDLDQWGTTVDTIKDIVEWVPGMLLATKCGAFNCVDIAHETLRDFLINQNTEAFAAVCRILTGWVVHTLQASPDLKVQTEQGREWSRASFQRLYRWSLLCNDVTVLEWVVRNKELQKRRIVISQALETSNRQHQKLSLLDLWVESLRTLVEEHKREDLRDELAWALNSRGLTYLNLHRRTRALKDIDRSVQLFEALVNEERKTQFRNGLAAAYNRRSEIHFSLANLDNALQDSTQAVQLFTDLVEDMGRDDLRPQLALAHRNQASVWSAAGNAQESAKSMQASIALFARLGETGDTRYVREQAWCHLQIAQQRQKAGQHEEALQEAGRAVSMLNALSEGQPGEDVRGQLERAHFVRGKSYLESNQADKAQRDFSKAVTLSSALLDEGRLDQRDELAQAFSLRARAQSLLGQPKEAIRDLAKAIELRSKLIQEGRSDQRLELAQEYSQRAEIYRTDRQEDAAQADLSNSQTLLTELRAQGLDVLEQLLKTHQLRAELGMQLGRFSEVIVDAALAITLLKELDRPTAQRLMEAKLYSLRGEGYRRLLQVDKAREDFEAAIQLYTELLQSEGDPTHLLGLAEAYGDLARVSVSSGQIDRALQEVTRSVEALEVAAKDPKGGDRRPRLAQAYSTRAEVLERQGQHQAARQELTRALQLYATLVEKEGQSHLVDEQALAYRRMGRTLLSLGEANPAREACEQSIRRYKELWSKDRKGPWLDEMSRTQVVNSAASVVLKEYGAAEEEIQRSLEHFSTLLDQGKAEYFDDVFQTSMQRAQNFIRVGLMPKAGEELTRLADQVRRTSLQFEKADFREFQVRVMQQRAKVYASQQSYENAYNDFEAAIQILQPLVVQESRFHLGKDLAELYRQRSKMLISAGHQQPGLADLSQAAQVLSILLQQGREELRRPLAQVAQERATIYQSRNELVPAVEDLNLGIDLLMGLAGRSEDADVFAELAQMLAQRGRCYQAAQQVDLASADFEKSVQLYTRLVEHHGRQELSAPLAEALLSHLSLSGQGVDDPSRVNALVRAVRLVSQQCKEGRAPEESFVTDALGAVRNSLQQRPEARDSELVDVVIKLVEAVLQMPKLQLNWVNLTELLVACFMTLDAVKGPKYMSFLCLAAVSCGREVQSLGAASMPRLIYFLTLVGVTLASERPSEQLSHIGNAFNALVENLNRQRLNPAESASLRQLVTTWQQLPAGYPAAAQVSRGVLTALLRAT